MEGADQEHAAVADAQREHQPKAGRLAQLDTCRHAQHDQTVGSDAEKTE